MKMLFAPPLKLSVDDPALTHALLDSIHETLATCAPEPRQGVQLVDEHRFAAEVSVAFRRRIDEWLANEEGNAET